MRSSCLQKACLILDEGLDDAVVHVWNVGAANETLFCGLTKERRGGRRKRATAKGKAARTAGKGIFPRQPCRGQPYNDGIY